MSADRQVEVLCQTTGKSTGRHLSVEDAHRGACWHAAVRLWVISGDCVFQRKIGDIWTAALVDTDIFIGEESTSAILRALQAEGWQIGVRELERVGLSDVRKTVSRYWVSGRPGYRHHTIDNNHIGIVSGLSANRLWGVEGRWYPIAQLIADVSLPLHKPGCNQHKCYGKKDHQNREVYKTILSGR